MAILKLKDKNGAIYEVPALKGEKGDKGDVGATPNLSIGTVTSLPPEESATVTIEGTAEAPILNFGFPKGSIGVTNLASFEDNNSAIEPIGDDSGGEEIVTSLPTDGLVAAFDFRNPNVSVDSAKGLTTFHPLTGSGCLFTWMANALASYNNYGSMLNRTVMFSASDSNLAQTEFGNEFTWCFLGYSEAFNGVYTANDHSVVSNTAQFALRPKYNTNSGQANVPNESCGDGGVGYHTVVFSVNGAEMKVYLDNALVRTYNGSDYEGFVSWYSKLTDSALPSNDKTYRTYLALYNKALTADEVSTVNGYFETLEVV